MRLTKRTRVDKLQNEVRRRGNSWDRIIYFGLVGAFLIWMFDIFAGEYVYLRADGLVLRDRVVLATQFTAQVSSLGIVEGSEVKKGEIVAQLRSQEVDEALAKLSSELAVTTGQRTQLAVRQHVIEAVRTSAQASFQAARVHRIKSEPLIGRNIMSNREVSEVLDSEYKTGQALAELEAEASGLKEDLPRFDSSIEEALLARDRLKGNYNGGKIESPVNGIVGSLPVRTGTVARVGDPLMEIFTGEPYVLAYVPEGALFQLRPKDHVNMRVGLKTYRGQVSRILSVTSQLPKEFQDTLRPPARAQVIHISFDAGQQPPTLFAKPRISATSWFPFSLLRSLASLFGSLDA